MRGWQPCTSRRWRRLSTRPPGAGARSTPRRSPGLQGPSALFVEQVLLCDTIFVIGALLLLSWAHHYAQHQHPHAAPCRGGWLDEHGRTALPHGHTPFMRLSRHATALLPAAAALLLGCGSGAAVALLLFGGYLAVLAVQALLEDRILLRECIRGGC